MNGIAWAKIAFGAALAAPLLGLLLALAILVFMSGVERIPPSEQAFAAWNMVSEGPETPDISRALLERPLLWASRRPLTPAVSATVLDVDSRGPADPKNPALEGYRLAGMFLSDLDAGVIVVSGKDRRRLVVGESIDGWMLEEIRDGGAVFLNRGSRGSKARSLVKLEHMLPSAGNQRAGSTSTKTDVNAAQESNVPSGQDP